MLHAIHPITIGVEKSNTRINSVADFIIVLSQFGKICLARGRYLALEFLWRIGYADWFRDVAPTAASDSFIVLQTIDAKISGSNIVELEQVFAHSEERIFDLTGALPYVTCKLLETERVEDVASSYSNSGILACVPSLALKSMVNLFPCISARKFSL